MASVIVALEKLRAGITQKGIENERFCFSKLIIIITYKH